MVKQQYVYEKEKDGMGSPGMPAAHTENAKGSVSFHGPVSFILQLVHI